MTIQLYRCHMSVVYSYFDPLHSCCNHNRSQSQNHSHHNHTRIHFLMRNYLDRCVCRSMGRWSIVHCQSIANVSRGQGQCHRYRRCCLVDLATMSNWPNRQPLNCIVNCHSCCNLQLLGTNLLILYKRNVARHALNT